MNDTTTNNQSKRPYLRKERRRRLLLESAADLVETQGWSALTMVSLSKHAKVSRQTVYEHFGSVDDLVSETVATIFKDVFYQIMDVMNAGTTDIASTVRTLENITYEIPAGRARALWQIIAAANACDAGLAKMSHRLRHLLIKQYHVMMVSALETTEATARPLTWMVIMAFWGSFQMVDAGEMKREDASRLFQWMIERLTSTPGKDGPPDLS